MFLGAGQVDLDSNNTTDLVIHDQGYAGSSGIVLYFKKNSIDVEQYLFELGN